MSAAITDKFKKVGVAGTLTTMAAPGKALAASSVNGNSLTNWPTDTGIIFAIRQVDSDGEEVAGTYTEWYGTVSSNTISNLSLAYGTDQVYAAGSTTQMYIPVSAKAHNDFVDGIVEEHSQLGYHSKNMKDSNGNVWLEPNAVSSAVNRIKVSNAATNNKPQIEASGSDTDIGLNLKPKGAGIHQLLDGNGNEIIKTAPAVASAVNELTVQNGATGNGPQLQATGDDTDINIRLVPKGAGYVKRGATGGAIDWYEELGRTTLGGAADTISITSFSARKYLKILVSCIQSGQISIAFRFNNDTGSNYSYRYSANGGADTTGTSQTYGAATTNETSDQFSVIEVVNIAAKEKLASARSASFASSGAGSAPTKWETNSKWANTSNQITRIDIINNGSGDFAAGSEVVVLGHD